MQNQVLSVQAKSASCRTGVRSCVTDIRQLKNEAETAANARLIAAAPELLAACHEVILVLEFAKRQDPGQAGLYHCPSVRRAIAHATVP